MLGWVGDVQYNADVVTVSERRLSSSSNTISVMEVLRNIVERLEGLETSVGFHKAVMWAAEL